MGTYERGAGMTEETRRKVQHQTGPDSYTENTVLKNAMTGEFMSATQHAQWWNVYREAYTLAREERQKHPERTEEDYAIIVAEENGASRKLYITPQISAMITASLAISEVKPTAVAI